MGCVHEFHVWVWRLEENLETVIFHPYVSLGIELRYIQAEPPHWAQKEEMFLSEEK